MRMPTGMTNLDVTMIDLTLNIGSRDLSVGSG